MEDLTDNKTQEYEPDVDELSSVTEQLTVADDYSLPSKICTFYSKFGFCKYGQKCRYLHRRYNSSDESFRHDFTSHNNDRARKANRVTSNYTKTRTFRNSGILNDVQNNPNIRKRICRYFRAGHCNNGESCTFMHSFEDHNTAAVTPLGYEKPIPSVSNIKQKSIPVCRYFKRGHCHNGDQCKFHHLHNYTSNDIDNASMSLENNLKESSGPEKVDHDSIDSAATGEVIKDINKTSLIPKNIFDLSSLSENEIIQLRKIEIIQLKKRFPNNIVIEENKSFSFIFQPSDPDWPLDMRSLQLQVEFPTDYPVEICEIWVLQTMAEVPEALIEYLNQCISDWLSERHEFFLNCSKVELLFRPFLKWFDKSLEELYRCGIEEIEQYLDARNEDETSEELVETSSEMGALYDLSESVCSNLPPENPEGPLEASQASVRSKDSSNSNHIAQKLGVKILFTGLEFVEGAAALSCTKLAIMLHCARCKTSCNVTTAPNRNNIVTCTKCSRRMECNFNPSVLHQFSNVLGTVYLVECQAVDVNLVESTFLVDCLNCSKQVAANRLHYGQKQKTWCMFCNQKLIISIESAKFQASAPSYISVKPAAVLPKKIEKKKDPQIKEGGPLPEFGTCRHYKKSNRWLRFPCCGKVYPCDICHDEKEIDHEMKFASRMICGFCSKEQPYSKDKPCISCSESMAVKSGSYWEGGKGCRNKLRMSRDDRHKYTGSSKTVSKRSQNSGTKKK